MPAKTTFPVKYPSVAASVFSIAVNVLILYYLLGLEKKHCACTLDKHHDSLKLLTYVNIAYPVVASVLIMVLNYVLNPKVVSVLWYLLHFVYALALFAGAVVLWRYVDLLNRQDCKCAEKDMQNINSFLLIWRWVMVAIYGLSVLGMIVIGLNLLR